MKFLLSFAVLVCVSACGHATSPLVTCSDEKMNSLDKPLHQCVAPITNFVGAQGPSYLTSTTLKNTKTLCSLAIELLSCVKQVFIGSGCFAKEIIEIIAAMFDGATNAANYLCANNANIAKELWKENFMACLESLGGNATDHCRFVGEQEIRSIFTRGFYDGWKSDFCSVTDQKKTCYKNAVINEFPQCSARASEIYGKFWEALTGLLPCTSNAVEMK